MVSAEGIRTEGEVHAEEGCNRVSFVPTLVAQCEHVVLRIAPADDRSSWRVEIELILSRHVRRIYDEIAALDEMDAKQAAVARARFACAGSGLPEPLGLDDLQWIPMGEELT
jgi:hypothetical protein